MPQLHLPRLLALAMAGLLLQACQPPDADAPTPPSAADKPTLQPPPYPASPGHAVPDGGFECSQDWWALERGVYLKEGVKPDWIPAVFDTGAPCHGERSLRIDNPRGDDWRLSGEDMELDPETSYTFSIAARAEKPDTILSAAFIGREGDKWSVLSGQWKLGPEWRRFSVSVKPEPGHRWYHLRISHNGKGGKSDAATGTIWLDDIQLVPGAAAEFAPPKIAAGLTQDLPRLYSTDSAGPYPATLRIRNNGATPKNVVAAWEVVDTWDDQVAASGTTDTLTIQPSSTAEVKLDLSPRRRGCFDARWQVVDATTGAQLDFQDHRFAMIDPIPAAIPPANAFTVGGQFSVRADWFIDNWASTSSVVLYGGSLDDMFDYRRDTGERWLRAWDFTWARLEPSEGRFDWSVTDLVVDACAKRGIRILASTNTLIAPDNPQSRCATTPAWAQELWKPRPGNGSMACDVTPVPPDRWAPHLAAAAARYQDRVAAWEIFNEPNLWLSPEEYVAYLRAASTSIRAADPKARIVGLCSTGDLGGRMAVFIDECYKLGVKDSFDILAFHPYDSRLDTSTSPAQVVIGKLKELTQKFGDGDKPLWNTELFYLTPEPQPYEYFKAPLVRGHEAARRFLIDLAYGVEHSFSVESTTYCQQIIAWRSWDDRGRKPVPNRIFVIYNTLARLFEGARPDGKPQLLGSTRLLRFIGSDGAPIAAAWSTAKDESIQLLNLPCEADKVVIFDVFGNPLTAKTAGHELRLAVGPAPAYLRPAKGVAPEEFANILDKATSTPRDPVALRACGTWTLDRRPAIVVEATNRLDTAFKSSIKVSATQGMKTVCSSMKDAAFAPGQAIGWIVPFETPLSPRESLTIQMEATNEGGDQSPPPTSTTISGPPVCTCPALGSEPTIDGKINEDEWATADSLRFDQEGGIALSPAGPDDCSGTIRIGRRANRIFLAAKIRDNARGVSKGNPAAWNRDALELFFDTRPDAGLAESGYAGKGGQFIIGLPLAEEEPAIVQDGPNSLAMAAGAKTAWRNVPGGWELEASLPIAGPLADAMSRPAVLGFAVVIDDADNDNGTKTRLFWAGDGENWRNRSGLGRMIAP